MENYNFSIDKGGYRPLNLFADPKFKPPMPIQPVSVPSLTKPLSSIQTQVRVPVAITPQKVIPVTPTVSATDIGSTTKFEVPITIKKSPVVEEIYNGATNTSITPNQITPEQQASREVSDALYAPQDAATVLDDTFRKGGGGSFSEAASMAGQRIAEIKKQSQDLREKLRNTPGMTSSGVENEIQAFNDSKANDMANYAISQSAATQNYENVLKYAQLKSGLTKESNEAQWKKKMNQYNLNKNQFSKEEQSQIESSLSNEKGIVQQKNNMQDIISKQQSDLIKRVQSGESVYQGLTPEQQLDRIGKITNVNQLPIQAQQSAKNFIDEQQILSVIPPTLRNSEKEGQRYILGIQTLLSQGYTPYQARSSMLGWNAPESEISNSLLDKAINFGTDKISFTGISTALGQGKIADAIKATENNILTAYVKENKDGAMNENTAKTAVRQADDITRYIQQLQASGERIPVGNLSINAYLGKFKSATAQTIARKATTAIAEMRNRLLGTATTESEKQFLQPIIPSLDDTMANFADKVTGLQTEPLNRYNETRESAGLPRISRNQLDDIASRAGLYGSSSTKGATKSSGGKSQWDW